MSSAYRGGNSRLLAKSLDELGRPLVLNFGGGNLHLAPILLADGNGSGGATGVYQAGEMERSNGLFHMLRSMFFELVEAIC